MNKSGIKLFIKDHLTLFLIVILTQLFFFGILFFLKGIWLREVLYYSFLVVFIMALYLVVRFYKKHRIYQKIMLKTEDINDFLLEEPRSRIEEHYNAMVYEILRLENKNTLRYDRQKSTQKMLMYRFIHQIKTPVSVIKLIAENHGEEKDFEKIVESLNVIQENMNQLLTMIRLDEFKNDFISEKVNLRRICKKTVNGLKDYFIAMQVYPKLVVDDNLYVYSDRKWLALVIHQLLTNAIKYSNTGGVVQIEAKKTEDKVILSVTDNGIGIHESEIAKIFDLFHIGENGRNNADSSGIGLFIAKSITDYMGHRLDIVSDKTKGETTAKITF